MSILSKTEVCKGDLYSKFNIVCGYVELSPFARAEFTKSVYNIINECPLDKWPEQAVECVKSLLNAHKCDVTDVDIKESSYQGYRADVSRFDIWADNVFRFTVFAYES